MTSRLLLHLLGQDPETVQATGACHTGNQSRMLPISPSILAPPAGPFPRQLAEPG